VKYDGIFDTFRRIHLEGERSIGIFFSGVVPRVFWISLGGFVYFGAYENSRKLFANM